MPLISVIDCETTGLNAARHDRVIEIAAVVIDPDGGVAREFVSLINPGRDVGKTSLHGITASDVADAPRFDQIVGHLAQTLDGTIALAGHNVSFDHRFLRCEFDRAGIAIPDVSTLCTMRIAGGGNLECLPHRRRRFQGLLRGNGLQRRLATSGGFYPMLDRSAS